MYCRELWKRIVPFALTLTLGLLVASFFQKERWSDKFSENIKSVDTKIVPGFGEGKGSGSGVGDGSDRETEFSTNSTVKILSKQQAKYTDAARQNEVEGMVTLRVTFLANGEIGAITTVTELPDGLTEQAIAAAKQLRFEPARRNGVAVTVVKTVSYAFTIY